MVEEACPVPFDMAQHQALLATTSTRDGVDYVHRYWFSREGLALVATTPAKLPAGVTIDAYCASQKEALTARFGEPRPTTNAQDFDWLWESAAHPDGVRLARTAASCELWRSSRAFAASNYASKRTEDSCFEPIALGDNRGNKLAVGDDTCKAAADELFVARPLRIDEEVDLQFDLRLDKPGELTVFEPAGAELATAETKPEPGLDLAARIRLKLAPGCYLVEVSTEGAKVESYYRLILEPYATWKQDDDLFREEQLGETGDEGPPTAIYPAIIMGEPPDRSGRVHLHTTAAIALLDAGNMYGMNTSIGVEVTRHSRIRAIVGGSASVMFQPTGDAFGTSNTMLPFGVWGGVRAKANPWITATARAGVLGYHISADADEMQLGAIDRSENGGGYVVGLDLTLGGALLGVERWLLGQGVTTFRLGFGF